MTSLKRNDANIVSAYLAGGTCKSVGVQFDVCAQTVCNILARNGIRAKTDFRRPIHDEGAFDQITPESAYWIGFLLADGCVHYLRGKYPKVVLELGIEDWEHVEKFRQFIQTETQVRPSHLGAAARLEVTSERIVDTLRGYGVTERKSFTASVVPELRRNRDFWRGVVDGDGNLGYNIGNGCPHLGLVGTRAVVEAFKEFCGIEGVIKDVGNVSTLVYYSHNAASIARTLYREATLFLDRKNKLADTISLHANRCNECGVLIEGSPHAGYCSSCRVNARKRKSKARKISRLEQALEQGRAPCKNCVKREVINGRALCIRCQGYRKGTRRNG